MSLIPVGPGWRGDPYHVVANFFIGPLNQAAVLPTQGKHDCPLTARDTLRLERPSSLRGLHWVFSLFCCFLPLGALWGSHWCSEVPSWFSSPGVAGSGRAHCSSPVTLASSIMTGFIRFSEHAPSSTASLHLSSPHPCLQASSSAPNFHRIPHLPGSHQPAPCSTICPSILGPFCLGLTGLN